MQVKLCLSTTTCVQHLILTLWTTACLNPWSFLTLTNSSCSSCRSSSVMAGGADEGLTDVTASSPTSGTESGCCWKSGRKKRRKTNLSWHIWSDIFSLQVHIHSFPCFFMWHQQVAWEGRLVLRMKIPWKKLGQLVKEVSVGLGRLGCLMMGEPKRRRFTWSNSQAFILNVQQHSNISPITHMVIFSLHTHLQYTVYTLIFDVSVSGRAVPNRSSSASKELSRWRHPGLRQHESTRAEQLLGSVSQKDSSGWGCFALESAASNCLWGNFPFLSRLSLCFRVKVKIWKQRLGKNGRVR